MMSRIVRPSIAAACLIGLTACDGKKTDTAAPAPAPFPAAAAASGDLSPFELENGIGPVKEKIVLGPADKNLAHKGQEVFEAKCTACHKMGEKYVGPALGEVTTRRTPTFIMNMVLNPQENIERHPVVKQLVAEHMTFMANQNLSVDEARAVVEYLRTQARGTVKTQ